MIMKTKEQIEIELKSNKFFRTEYYTNAEVVDLGDVIDFIFNAQVDGKATINKIGAPRSSHPFHPEDVPFCSFHEVSQKICKCRTYIQFNPCAV